MGKKICNVLSTIIIICLVALAAVLFVPRVLGYQEYAVLSGSMVPKIPVGSLVYDKKPEQKDYKVGKVVTYKLSENTLVTHRIVKVDTTKQTVTTKGDANNTEDAAAVAYTNIVGSYKFHIPYLGYMSIYGRTPIGIGVVCGVLIIIILLNFLPDALSDDDDDDKKKKATKKIPESKAD
jgi:signal peptidase